MPEPIYIIDERSATELRQIIRLVRSISGPYVKNDGQTITIGAPSQTQKSDVAPLSNGCIVRITSAATGGGKYFGNIVDPPTSDVASSGNLSASEIGTTGQPCLVLNAEEEGQSTHDLTSGTPKVSDFIGVITYVNSDNTPIVVINGLDWKTCT